MTPQPACSPGVILFRRKSIAHCPHLSRKIPVRLRSPNAVMVPACLDENGLQRPCVFDEAPEAHTNGNCRGWAGTAIERRVSLHEVGPRYIHQSHTAAFCHLPPSSLYIYPSSFAPSLSTPFLFVLPGFGRRSFFFSVFAFGSVSPTIALARLKVRLVLLHFLQHTDSFNSSSVSWPCITFLFHR